MIEITQTKEVEDKLKEYKNLKMVSHDRGIQYVNISNEYIHVLDRFHLLQNLFKSIKEKINSEFSNVIKFSKKVDATKEIKGDKTIKLNAKQLIKRDMITKARKHRKKGLSFSEISRIMNLDRRTVKKIL